MQTQFSSRQRQIHERALQASRVRRDADFVMIEILLEVEENGVHKAMGKKLYSYAVDTLRLDEYEAYQLIAVARRCREIPVLKLALQEQRLSVGKTSRMLSILTRENAEDLVAFAETHTQRELDFEVARLNPKARRRDQARPVDANNVELKVHLPKALMEKLERARSLVSLRENKDWSSTFGEVFEFYLDRKDPVRKAQRAEAKNSVQTEKPKTGRHPFTAAQKHAVNNRDNGHCTFIDAQGVRCNQDRWLHIHHLRPVSEGGTNSPENLTTLCAFHHDLVHQLSLPLDGEANYVRCRTVSYGVARRIG